MATLRATKPPDLLRGLEMARRGELDVIVAREMDRLARDLAKQLCRKLVKVADAEVEYMLAEYDESPARIESLHALSGELATQ